jgi:hypothetical protein
MPKVFSVLALFSATMLAGCGLIVPQIRDFPNNNDISDDALAQAIVDSIHCELADAVTSTINDNGIAAGRRLQLREVLERLGR